MQKIPKAISDPNKYAEVKVIDLDGNFLGIMETSEAIEIARIKNLDLVEIPSNSATPLCKICKLKDLLAENKRKAKLNKKNAKSIVEKELRIRPRIDKHDLQIKVNHTAKLLQKKCHIVLCMRFKGREKLHVEQGKELLQNVIEQLRPYGLPKDENMKLIGNQIILKFEPIKSISK